jgi:hypothetical protein
MLSRFFQWLPPESIKILLVLGLSLLVGSEREEHKAAVEQPTFGGVRTYPLIGLIGYAMALLGAGQLLPLTRALPWWEDSCFSLIGTSSPLPRPPASPQKYPP